jgi:hypothetical protein
VQSDELNLEARLMAESQGDTEAAEGISAFFEKQRSRVPALAFPYECRITADDLNLSQGNFATNVVCAEEAGKARRWTRTHVRGVPISILQRLY